MPGNSQRQVDHEPWYPQWCIFMNEKTRCSGTLAPHSQPLLGFVLTKGPVCGFLAMARSRLCCAMVSRANGIEAELVKPHPHQSQPRLCDATSWAPLRVSESAVSAFLPSAQVLLPQLLVHGPLFPMHTSEG